MCVDVVSASRRLEARQELGRRTPRSMVDAKELACQSPTAIASLRCVCLKGGRFAEAVDVMVAD